MNKTTLRWVEKAVILGLVILSGWLAFQRNALWKNASTLWSDTVAKSPLKARPHRNLAIAFNQTGYYDKAISEADNSVRIQPGLAVAQIVLGNSYFKKGMIDEALIRYKEALRMDSGLTEAHLFTGNSLMEKGLVDQFIDE